MISEKHLSKIKFTKVSNSFLSSILNSKVSEVLQEPKLITKP
jgi:hypothetical protein